MDVKSLKNKLEETEQPVAKIMKIDSKCVLRFAKLTEQALAPVRGSERSAGVDLCSAYDLTVPARGKAIAKTDLQVQVPEGSYGRVAPRSGLAVKNFIDVGAGVIDEDYRGNLGVVLFNHSDVDFKVKRGDRIAQFICERIFYPDLEEVDKLDETTRGTGGFGSTGIKEIAAKTGNGSTPMDTEESKISESANGATKVIESENCTKADEREEAVKVADLDKDTKVAAATDGIAATGTT